jgi:hypothetical protein
MKYEVRTIGGLGLAGQEWPTIPPGWVPAGTPGIKNPDGSITPPPVPGPPPPRAVPSSVDSVGVALVGLGGVVVGALGLWGWARFGSNRKKRRR